MYINCLMLKIFDLFVFVTIVPLMINNANFAEDVKFNDGKACN